MVLHRRVMRQRHVEKVPPNYSSQPLACGRTDLENGATRMGRPRKTRLFPLSLSIDATADALSCPRRKVSEAVYLLGTLPAYSGPNNSVRILVKDVVHWVESTWPKAKKRKSTRKKEAPHADRQ
jgi:hypothetical protein